MKTKILTFASILLAGCTSFSENTKSDLPVVDIVCPYGHHSVRRVPVVNGLVAIDERMQARLDRYELVYGGCTGTQSTALLCGKCGFRFDDAMDGWERTSSDPNSFKPVISSALRGFEKLLHQNGNSYSQLIHSDGSIYEHVVFYSKESVSRLREILDQCAAEYGMTPGRHSVPTIYGWRSKRFDWSISLTDLRREDPSAMILVMHRIKEANKASLPTPVAVTPAANAPIVPQPGAAGL